MPDYGRLAPRTAIINVLKDHGSLTVDQIANLIGRSSEETERTLEALEDQGLVLRQGNKVSLV